jgi:hypothetical protein
MITYEELVKQITDAGFHADINLYGVQHKIVMPQMDREFVAQCVPDHYKSPHLTRAQISFSWDSTMTSQSIYGGNCALFHNEMEECIHDELENQACIELEVEYHFQIMNDFERSTDLINTELIQLFDMHMAHENQPILNWGLIINKSRATSSVSNLSASYHWIFELEDEELSFDRVFMEIREVLIELNNLPFIKKTY